MICLIIVDSQKSVIKTFQRVLIFLTEGHYCHVGNVLAYKDICPEFKPQVKHL